MQRKKNENAILISQPHKNISNVFEIKTNIDAESTVLLTLEIEQYLQKEFEFNICHIQILRNFNKYNIIPNFKHISFTLNICDESGIYDVDLPLITNNDNNYSDDIVIDSNIMDVMSKKCEINGKIICKQPAINDIEMFEEWRYKLQINDNIDVQDGNKWYKSEIIEINTDKNKIKINYNGYNSKYDEWINIDSDRLSPFNRKSINEIILKYKIKGEENGSHILFDNKSNTFCHIISDININIDNKILIPRRVMFVIDRSGSMRGLKWEKTIFSTIMAIKQLKIGYDRFGIILFSNNIKLLPYKDMNGCILADDKNIDELILLLKNETVGGSTNINDALLKGIEMIKTDIISLNNDSNSNYKYNFFKNQIVFITDGKPNRGEDDTNKIITNIQNANDLSKIDKYNDKISIFSFGIGNDGNDSEWINDLNHTFLKLLSVHNNGFYQRIKKTSADIVLSQYFNILSKPVLLNINVKYKNKNIKQLTETKFNTLYYGNDLIICGKIENYQQYINNTLLLSISAITGRQIKEKENEKLIIKPVTISKQMKIYINTNNTNNKTERIWAYLKLQQFAKQKLIHNDMIEMDDDEKKEDDALPLSLALKYKFVTPWTSMIVVKDKENENKENKQYKLFDEEFKGWEYHKNPQKWDIKHIVEWITFLDEDFGNDYGEKFILQNISGQNFKNSQLGNTEWCRNNIGIKHQIIEIFAVIVTRRIMKYQEIISLSFPQMKQITHKKLSEQEHRISKLEKKIDKMGQQNYDQMQTLDLRLKQMMGMFQMFMMNANQLQQEQNNDINHSMWSQLKQSQSALNVSQSIYNDEISTKKIQSKNFSDSDYETDDRSYNEDGLYSKSSSKSRKKHKHKSSKKDKDRKRDRKSRNKKEKKHKQNTESVNVVDFVEIDCKFSKYSQTMSDSRTLLDHLNELELDIATPSDEESLIYVEQDTINIGDDSDIEVSYDWNINDSLHSSEDEEEYEEQIDEEQLSKTERKRRKKERKKKKKRKEKRRRNKGERKKCKKDKKNSNSVEEMMDIKNMENKINDINDIITETMMKYINEISDNIDNDIMMILENEELKEGSVKLITSDNYQFITFLKNIFSSSLNEKIWNKCDPNNIQKIENNEFIYFWILLVTLFKYGNGEILKKEFIHLITWIIITYGDKQQNGVYIFTLNKQNYDKNIIKYVTKYAQIKGDNM